MLITKTKNKNKKQNKQKTHVLNRSLGDSISTSSDLITSLIIAKGGQCKDVYVPENFQIGS